MNINWNSAFPPMEDREYHALMDAARSVQEEVKPVKQKFPKAILILVLITLLTASMAVAETLGMFQFLDRRMGTKVLPSATSATNIATLENDYAVYAIQEAAYDGLGMSAMVRITPKDSKTFLLGEGGYGLEDNISWVLNDESYGEMTVAEYMQQKGYERSVTVSVEFGTGDVSGIEEFDGNALTIVYSFAAEGESGKSVTIPYRCFAWCSEENRQSVVPGELTLSAAAPLWTAEVTKGAEIPLSGLRIDSASLVGTGLGMHVELRLTVTDVEIVKKNQTGIHLHDAQGNPLRPGASADALVEYLPPTENGESFIKRFCVVPTETAPEALYLSIYQYDTEQETFIALPVNVHSH